MLVDFHNFFLTTFQLSKEQVLHFGLKINGSFNNNNNLFAFPYTSMVLHKEKGKE